MTICKIYSSGEDKESDCIIVTTEDGGCDKVICNEEKAFKQYFAEDYNFGYPRLMASIDTLITSYKESWEFMEFNVFESKKGSVAILSYQLWLPHQNVEGSYYLEYYVDTKEIIDEDISTQRVDE